jgi:hypothetical protein
MTDLYTPCTFTISNLSKCQKAFNELNKKYYDAIKFIKMMANPQTIEGRHALAVLQELGEV